ncbi:MAG: hypothetical protein GF364_12180 [Candidatus Lokiarchaeota archaeon]|nr:hypothetical protein [Candidatus Lokiarchaeota archaeon]
MRRICNHPFLDGNQYKYSITPQGSELELKDDPNNSAIIDITHLLELSNKLDITMGIIKDILDNKPNDKIIIFVHYIDSGKFLVDLCEILFAEKPQFLHGESRNKQRIINNFKNNPLQRILIANGNTAGVGLDLQIANHAIHFDKRWSHAVVLQATRRIYRRGQTKDVYVYRFTTLHTIEEDMQKRIDKKEYLLELITRTPMNQNIQLLE